MKDNPPFSPKLPPEFAEKLIHGGDGSMSIEITNMRLRTYIGINDWEQEHRQDVLINIKINCAAKSLLACASDDINDTINYKAISKKVISCVEDSRFMLVEKMAAAILAIVLGTPMVSSASVKVEKPGALRFSDSVGVCLQGSNV